MNEKKLNNIILIGYMGAGKSAVGKALSKKLSYDFLDTDQYIVEKEGMAISDIFSKKGEAYFRQLETELIVELKEKLTHTIISTGGGLPIKSENQKLLKELGTVYYLKATPDTTYRRVSGNNDRPLLAVDNMYEKICTMLIERTPKYEATGDIIINTDELTIDEIVNIIAEAHQ